MHDCTKLTVLGLSYVGFITANRSCDSRKYTYFFPSYLLLPPKPTSAFARGHHAATDSPSDTPQHPFWDLPGAHSSGPEEDLVRKRQWRVGAKAVDELRAAAKKFQGTHNFHNFTVGRDFADRSNQRNMIKIHVRFSPISPAFFSACFPKVADPVVYGDTEWISVLFHGQSFMLHQVRSPYDSRVSVVVYSNQGLDRAFGHNRHDHTLIVGWNKRKMMSSLVLSCRTGTPAEIIDEVRLRCRPLCLIHLTLSSSMAPGWSLYRKCPPWGCFSSTPSSIPTTKR